MNITDVVAPSSIQHALAGQEVDTLELMTDDAEFQQFVDHMPTDIRCKKLILFRNSTSMPPSLEHLCSELASRCGPSLTGINITWQPSMDDGVLALFARRCPHIRSLAFATCHNLRSFGDAHDMFWPELTHLSLKFCASMNHNGAFLDIAASCPKLTHLDFSSPIYNTDAITITDEGLLPFATSCEHLTYLNLRIRCAISDEFLSAFAKKGILQYLVLKRCQLQVTRAGIMALLAMPSLSRFTINEEIEQEQGRSHEQVLSKALTYFGVEDVAHLAWACATLGFHDELLIRHLLSRAERSAAELSKQARERAIWAQQTFKGPPPHVSAEDKSASLAILEPLLAKVDEVKESVPLPPKQWFVGD